MPYTIIRNVEERFLSLLLVVLIGLSCLQIGLRVFFDSGLPWADPLLRHLVVWCGLMGAVRGVADHKHISVDVLLAVLPHKTFIRRLIYVVAATICCILSYASYLFIAEEISYATATLMGIPSWCWSLIFPLAFSAMALRYAYLTCFLTKASKSDGQVS